MSCSIVRRCFTLLQATCQSGWRSYRTMARNKGSKRAPTPKRPPLTHFLCVPLITTTSRPLIEASLREFRDAVSNPDQTATEDVETGSEVQHGAKLPPLHPKAIRPAGALHLTLGVMSLDKNKLSEAVEYLNGDDVGNLLKSTINESSRMAEEVQQVDPVNNSSTLQRPVTPPVVKRSGGPLEVYLKGLESMHPPRKTSILYIAPVDESGRLYPFCVALQKLFKDKGFLIEDNRPLKLHATIVNTIHVKGRKRPARRDARQETPESSLKGPTSIEHAEKTAVEIGAWGGNDDRPQVQERNANASLRIDATVILEKYKDLVWAENVVLDRVAICEMGAKKILDNEGKEVGGEYTEVASIPLLAQSSA